MLNTAKVAPTIPVTDLKRAIDFYQNRLGLKILSQSEGDASFEAGSGSELYIYKRGPSKADHTLAGFTVNNIEEAVAALAKNGVKFEQYNNDWIKTNELGIADIGTERAAWFKDPDGNILGVSQRK